MFEDIECPLLAVQKGGYDQKYRCEHCDAKGRIAEWLAQQPYVVSDTELSWSVVTSGPYMDMTSSRRMCWVQSSARAGRSCSTRPSAMVTCP